jgi:hypothetical protein
MDGALGDLEAVGELAAGDAAFGLEEEKRGKETVGLHGRVLALSSNFFLYCRINYDSRCHIWKFTL